MKNFLTILALFFAVTLSSCATVEEGTETDADTQTETADTDADESRDGAPDWYEHANRAYTDSISFSGLGLAAAADSVSASDQAKKQALAHIKLSIDRYAEDVRREKADEPGGEMFSTNRFIIDLRNAVQQLNLDRSINYTTEHIEKENSVHNVYIRASINKEEAIEVLGETLGNAEFVKTVRESVSTDR